jgi:hypothetical protein
MLQAGAKKIIYGPNQTRMSLPIDTYAQILKGQPVVIERFKHDKELYNQQPRIALNIDQKLKDGIEDITFEWNTPGILWEKIEDSPA